MKIVAGLGNPGTQYQGTVHNLGFDVVDVLARRHGITLQPSRKESADLAEGRIGGEKVILARPMTYMNLSGRSIREIMKNRPTEAPDLLVVVDDINIDLGRLRLRESGSAGGHNGLKSVAECLGTQEYPRLRLGARPQRAMGDVVSYVLSRPKPAEREEMARMTERAADAVECWLSEGFPAVMNKFND